LAHAQTPALTHRISPQIEHRLFSHITFNWRGRPLTSHEVVVKTIAATTTRSGLRVEAALDTGDYPTGVAISKQRLDALPLRRHATHSAWNYTLHPRPAATQPEPVAEQDGPARRRQAMLGRLGDSRLTGMTSTDLQQLAAVLAPAQAARTQQRYAEQRGGRARRAAGKSRGRPLFDDAARLLLTLVYQRQICSMTVLADLLEVTDTCIGSLVHETREVLEDHSYSPTIASMRFATAHDLLAFLDQDLRPARTATIHTLSAPALTGMSRQELHQLTQRLTPRQAAHAERRTHQRRGGPRQPGTRGGVFPQKISNSERVLLTVLHLRRLCTLDVLADALGDVCRSAIGNAVRETRPLLLEQDGRIPPRRPSATAPPPNSSPPEQPAATHQQLDSLRLHKLRNVTDRLPDAVASTVAKRLRRAYHQQDALLAQADLEALARELDRSHPGAAASLREGLPETLTIARLGVPPTLARTLRSTNSVESMIAICRDHAANVKRWRDGQMVLRWVAAGMGEAAKQFRRVNGHLHLPALRAALDQTVAAVTPAKEDAA
jgi:hypothetical protein